MYYIDYLLFLGWFFKCRLNWQGRIPARFVMDVVGDWSGEGYFIFSGGVVV